MVGDDGYVVASNPLGHLSYEESVRMDYAIMACEHLDSQSYRTRRLLQRALGNQSLEEFAHCCASRIMIPEPLNVKEAMASEHAAEWREAIQEEINTLAKFQLLLIFSICFIADFSIAPINAQTTIYIDTYQDEINERTNAMDSLKALLVNLTNRLGDIELFYFAHERNPRMVHSESYALQLAQDSLNKWNNVNSDVLLNRKIMVRHAIDAGWTHVASPQLYFILFEHKPALLDDLVRPMLCISDGIENNSKVKDGYDISVLIWNGSSFVTSEIHELINHE